MYKRIVSYSLRWRAEDEEGRIYIRLGDTNKEEHEIIKVTSAQELSALGEILRNEEEVFFDSETGIISTGWEPTGPET